MPPEDTKERKSWWRQVVDLVVVVSRKVEIANQFDRRDSDETISFDCHDIQSC